MSVSLTPSTSHLTAPHAPDAPHVPATEWDDAAGLGDEVGDEGGHGIFQNRPRCQGKDA